MSTRKATFMRLMVSLTVLAAAQVTAGNTNLRDQLARKTADGGPGPLVVSNDAAMARSVLAKTPGGTGPELQIRTLSEGQTDLVLSNVALSEEDMSGSSTLLAELVSSGSGEKEKIWGPGDWQRITYNCDIDLELDIDYNTQRGDIHQYVIKELRGTIHFWGTARDELYGITWNFDKTHNLTIVNPPSGLLEYSESKRRVTYLQSSLGTPTGDIKFHWLDYYGLAHPHSARLAIEFPSDWWWFNNNDYIYGNCTTGMGVDLTDSVMLSPRANVTYDANFQYNSGYPGNWRMVDLGAYIQTDFELDTVPGSANLVIDHLSAASGGCPGGGYSPVDIIVNGNYVESCYDPAENHGGTHSFVTDNWDISSYLQLGSNSIRIALCDNFCTHYWIRYLYIEDLGDDCANCDLEMIRVTEISVRENVPIRDVPDIIWNEDVPEVFHPVADGEYEVEVPEAYMSMSRGSASANSKPQVLTMPGTTFEIKVDVPASIGNYDLCQVKWDILDNQTIFDSEIFELPSNKKHFVVYTNKKPKIGQYKLRLTFSFWNISGRVGPPQVNEHIFYVIHSDQAIKALPYLAREFHIKKATEFAKGAKANDPDEILQKIMDNFRQQGWDYEYWKSRLSWYYLLYNSQYTAGNCLTFRDAWCHLSNVLGVLPEREKDPVQGRFLTISPAIALDGIEGNAFTDNEKSDRWGFLAHHIGFYKGVWWNPVDKPWYDPTFTMTYDSSYDFIWAKLTKKNIFGIAFYEADNAYDVYWNVTNLSTRQVRYQPLSVFVGDVNTNLWYIGATEGDAGTKIAKFDVILTREPENTIEVYYSTVDGTATAPDDYIAKIDQSLIFQPGQTAKTIEIEIKGDPNMENSEYFLVELTSTDAFVPQGGIYKYVRAAQCTIIDDDSTPSSNLSHTMMNSNQNPHFTGSFSSNGYDENEDGIFEALAIDVEVDGSSGEYYVSGVLRKDANTVAERENMYDEIPTYASLTLSGTEPNSVALMFSGEDIFQSGADGNYIADITLSEPNGLIWDLATYETQAFSHLEFGELPVRLLDIGDEGIDDDNDGLFDWLSIEVELDIIQQKEYYAVVSLKTDPNSVGFMFENGPSDPCDPNSIFIFFDGRYIKEKGIDGSYTVNVSLYDPNENFITAGDYTTGSYTADMFEPPPAEFTGNCTDYIVNSDSVCPLDLLVIDVEVKVAEPNTYEINGYLFGSDANAIEIVTMEVYLGIGTTEISLEFDGKYIAENGIDGPYYLSYVAMRQQNADNNGYLTAAENIHETDVYLACEFDPDRYFASGDFNCSCVVGLEDLAILCSQWLQPPGVPSADIAPDPVDNFVNLLDFAILAENWLKGTTP